MTAFVLITFLESKYKSQYKSEIDKASDYIANSIPDEPYPLAISTYALQLANHLKKNEFLDKLNSIGRTRDEKKFWQRNYQLEASPIDREMTAYALLAHVAAGKVIEAIPIMKWLVEQRNSRGGFESSQETVVGIQALTQMAKHLHSMKSDVTILLNGKDLREKRDLDVDTNAINVQVKGQGGMALVQISYEFNVLRNETGQSTSFSISVEPTLSNNNNTLSLKVCTSYIPKDIRDEQKTNMAMIEVSMPSGFKFDTSTKDGLIKENKIWVRKFDY
jgi:CD109 antigen